MFDLGRELLRLGHDVMVFTNYPRVICGRFGLPPDQVVNNVPHGIFTRALQKVFPRGLNGGIERVSNTIFGRWAARAVASKGVWDVVVCMSGVAEEVFLAIRATNTQKVLHRGSVHIRAQQQILAQEQEEGGGVEQPSAWIIAREEREYVLADLIQVHSPFAMMSFFEYAIAKSKLDVLQLGVDTGTFRPPPNVLKQRCQRLRSSEPLRAICVGTFSRQKGSRIWAEAIKSGSLGNTQVRFVGAVNQDSQAYAEELSRFAQFVGKVPQHVLPEQYQWADVFVLPSLQDGFAVVVTQALASGLPVLTTTSCGASALVREGETGWVIPPGRSDLLADRIRWASENRSDVAAMVGRLADQQFNRDWAETARDAVTLYTRRALSLNLSPPGTAGHE